METESAPLSSAMICSICPISQLLVGKDMHTAGQVKEIKRIIALCDPHKGLMMQQLKHSSRSETEHSFHYLMLPLMLLYTAT